jgi:hypothetical protein
MEFIKNNFLSVIILGLVLILFFSKGKEPKSTTTILRDTVWVHTDSTVYTKPQIIKTIPVIYTERTKEYIPDTNYSQLVSQYNHLVNKYLASNIYKDSLKIDSIGHIYIKDTVSNNLLKGRSISYSLKYPLINNYIPINPKNQIYYGGGVLGSPTEIINNIHVGALLKTKRDRIVGLNVGLNSTGSLTYGVSSYWKISFRK